MVVKLPGNRVIIVDAKVPDLEFLTAMGTADDVKRGELLKAHADKLKGTIKDLASRNYSKEFAHALDYVVLFLPAESLFSAALEGDPDLIVWAAQRKVLLATPASLIALLRSVSASWKHHEQTENAQKIATAASELYSRVATFTEHFEKIGAGLETAASAFNKAQGSYQKYVKKSGERLLELGVDSGNKALAEPEVVQVQLKVPPVA